MTSNDLNSNQEIIHTSSIKNNFTIIQNIAFHSGLKPEVMWVWAYFVRCADESMFKTTQEKTCKILNITAPRYLRIKEILIKHNLISETERPNKLGGSGKPRLQINANDPSEWKEIEWTNENKTRAKTDLDKTKSNTTSNKTLLVTSNKTLLDNQSQNVTGDNKNGKNKKKIDNASIYQDDKITGEDMKSKLAAHEFRKELKQNAQTKAEKLQKIRTEVSTLEKKLAEQDKGKLSREVFMKYLPSKVSIDSDISQKIRNGLSGFNLEGTPQEFKKALLMSYKLYDTLGEKSYFRIMKNLSKVSHLISASEYANLYKQEFQEKYGKSLYEHLILG
jgi:hypothetical protein